MFNYFKMENHPYNNNMGGLDPRDGMDGRGGIDRGELDPRGIESKLGRLNLQDEMSNKKRESSPHYAELKVTIWYGGIRTMEMKLVIWCGV